MSKKHGIIVLGSWTVEANQTDDGYLNVYVRTNNGSPTLVKELFATKGDGGVCERYTTQRIQDAEDAIVPDRFRVDEWSCHFELVDLVTGLTHWLSDGVDAFFDENDEAISPGTPGFAGMWTRLMNESQWETMDACWPALFNANGYDWPMLELRWVIVLSDGRWVHCRHDGERVGYEPTDGTQIPGYNAIPFMELPDHIQRAVAQFVYGDSNG